jgi:hypothetical protein
MKRACLVATLVLASTPLATAGGYIGIGIGTSPAMTDDSADLNLAADGRSGRLLVGSRWGQISFEGALGKYDVLSPGRQPFELYQGSIAGKASFPLGNGFEAFGRLGLQRTWLVNPIGSFDKDGNGFLLGGGFEYKFDVAPTRLSLFVDYQYNAANLDGDRGPVDVSSRMWTLGVTLGF